MSTGTTKKRPSMRAEDVEARLDEIVRLRNLYEYSWREIGERVDMHPDAARNAYAAWLNGDRDAILHEDPVEVVQRKLYGYRYARRRLVEIAESATTGERCKECGEKCGHHSRPETAANALRVMRDLDRQDVVLRQLTGCLPRKLSDLENVVAVRTFMQMVFDVLDENLVVGEQITDALIDKIDTEIIQSIWRGNSDAPAKQAASDPG